MITANLVMFRQNGERRDFALNPERTIVGRKHDCDIRIPLTEVSRRHAEFRIKEQNVVIRDLGSANGTFVNNKRVSETRLAPGDKIVIGPVVFTVQVNGQPQDLKPVKTKLQRQRPAAATADKSARPATRPEVLSQSDDLDPISALEALASSADQTAIDPFDEGEELK